MASVMYYNNRLYGNRAEIAAEVNYERSREVRAQNRRRNCRFYFGVLSIAAVLAICLYILIALLDRRTKDQEGAKTAYEVTPLGKDMSHVWGEWNNWRTCSATCGGGSQSRSRACVNSTSRMPDGKGKCVGRDVEIKPCYNGTCPVTEERGNCSNRCHCDASYIKHVSSYSCRCNSGYRGNGFNCTDFDECTNGTLLCHTNAVCTNTRGSYICRCKSGFAWIGETCTDFNECCEGSHTCHTNAVCSNTPGSFTCQCKSGFSVNGTICSDINECTDGSNQCNSNALCNNTVGSYNCTCNRDYCGNGTTCIQCHRGLGQSSILSSHGNITYLLKLSSYLAPVLQSSNSSRWRRCWRAQTNGWASCTFHYLCDGKGPSVTIIRVGSYVFGGYTDVSWHTNGYSRSSRSFLYSLYNIKGYYPIKLTLTGRWNHRAIWGDSDYGPTFGYYGYGDIWISNNAGNNKQSYTNPWSYQPPPGCSFNDRKCSFLAGSYWFTPSDVEVFYETTT